MFEEQHLITTSLHARYTVYVCVKKKCEQSHFLQVLPEWKSYDSLPHVDLAESYPPAFQQTYVLSFPSGLAKTNFTLILNQYFVLSNFQTPEVVSVKKIDISNLYCFLWFVHVLYFHAACQSYYICRAQQLQLEFNNEFHPSSPYHHVQGKFSNLDK